MSRRDGYERTLAEPCCICFNKGTSLNCACCAAYRWVSFWQRGPASSGFVTSLFLRHFFPVFLCFISQSRLQYRSIYQAKKGCEREGM